MISNKLSLSKKISLLSANKCVKYGLESVYIPKKDMGTQRAESNENYNILWISFVTNFYQNWQKEIG